MVLKLKLISVASTASTYTYLPVFSLSTRAWLNCFQIFLELVLNDGNHNNTHLACYM